MKFIFAPDSFKGTLSSEKIIEILSKVSKKVFPNCEIVKIPMADGGEGTGRILVSIMNGSHQEVKVKNPLGENVKSEYGILNQNTAIIEMAAASGLTLIPEEKRNPLYTTTYGTGELINAALLEGYINIIVAVGGSATNDGGMGAMEALGVRFYDEYGHALEGKGENLIRISNIDISNINPLVSQANFRVICDVENPLIGSEGATYVYGAQKGGTQEQLDALEKGMEHYAKLLEANYGIKIASQKGMGAAGGLSAAMVVFCNASLQSGVQTILETVHFDELLKDVDLVITGEGKVDSQSACGKVLSGIGEYCKRACVPAIAIVGCMESGIDQIYDKGIVSIMPVISGFWNQMEAFTNSESLLEDAAFRMFQFIQIGEVIGKNSLMIEEVNK